ncbi:MAG: hypothetical protein ABSC90_00065 [Acidimicrobiales bacterium]|jgi:hypothetical protein
MDLDDWNTVLPDREDVESITAVDGSSSSSDEEWPPMPALVPIVHSAESPGWRVDHEAPGWLRYWDGQHWTRYSTPQIAPRAIPGMKQTRTADDRAKTWVTALGAVLFAVALIAAVLPTNKNSAEPRAMRISTTTTPASSDAQQPPTAANAAQPTTPSAATSPVTSAPRPAPTLPAINPSPNASHFVSDLGRVGSDETAIADDAGAAESSGNLAQVGTECGILSTDLATLRGDTVPNTLTPVEQTGLTSIEGDLTDAANECAQGVANHETASIISAITLFSSAGSLINQLDSQLS